MSVRKHVRTRRVALAAGAAAIVGLATAGSAAASPLYESSPAPAPTTAAIGTASVANNTLTINGTSDADVVAMSENANDPNTLLVSFGTDATHASSFDRSTFTSISVFLGNGDDQFTESPGVVRDEPLIVDAGNGNDIVHTAGGADTVFGGSGNDFIRTGDGNDVIFGGAGNDDVDGERGNDIAILEGGNDTFTWNPGEGSDIVVGGSGLDTLQFNGANVNENMSLSPNGPNAVFLRDVANIRMDLSELETVNVSERGGADNFTVNDMTGTSVRHANIDVAAPGTDDAQPDLVTVNGTPLNDKIKVDAGNGVLAVEGLTTETVIADSHPSDHLQVNGQGGNDDIRVRNDETLASIAVNLSSPA